MERLKGLDASFLYMETPKTQFHVAFATVLNPEHMPGGYSFQKIMDLVAAKVATKAAFRRRLVRVPMDLHHPVWIDDPDFDVIHHVRQVALPSPGGPEALGKMIGRIQTTTLDRSRALWEIWIIEGLEGGRIAMMLKMHHAFVDGVSGSGLLMHLLETSRDAPLPKAPPPMPPERIPTDGELIAYALRSRISDPDRFFRVATQSIQGIKDVIERRKSPDAHPGVTPLQAPPTHFNQAVSGRRNLAFTSIELEDIKAVKNELGATVNDIVVAVCGGALRAYLEERGELPDTSLTAVCPISVRTKEQASMVDNRVSAMWTALGTDIADPVERCRKIHEYTQAAKEEHNAVGAHLLQDWAELAAPSTFNLAVRLYSHMNIASKHRPIHNLVISNVPGPRFSLFFAGAEVESILPMGPVMEGSGLNITVMSYRDSVDFALLVDADLVPEVWKLAHLMSAAFADLAKAAGVTISKKSDAKKPVKKKAPAKKRPAARKKPAGKRKKSAGSAPS